MVVDWLQACYESDFCVDATTGETIRGRYYFASPGADVFPYPHYYGSGVFLDEASKPFGTYLGDQFTNVTADDGRKPLVLPLSRRNDVAYSPACAGEKVRLALTDDTFEGLPKRCYRQAINACTSYEAATDPNNPETWCWVADVIDMIYNSDPGIVDFVHDHLPGDVVVGLGEPVLPQVPRWIGWKGSCGQGLIMNGTETFQQLSLQALYASHGPQPIDEGFATSNFWYVASLIVQAQFNAFVGPRRGRTFLAGHSYGGAVAGIMAAREVTPLTKATYDLVTLAAPRMGSEALYSRLALDRCRFIQTEGDPVPSMPPAYPALTDLSVLISPLTYFYWQRWAPPPLQTVVRPDRTVYTSRAFNAAPILAVTIATVIRDFGIYPTFDDHLIATYKDRLCPP